MDEEHERPAFPAALASAALNAGVGSDPLKDLFRQEERIDADGDDAKKQPHDPFADELSTRAIEAKGASIDFGFAQDVADLSA